MPAPPGKDTSVFSFPNATFRAAAFRPWAAAQLSASGADAVALAMANRHGDARVGQDGREAGRGRGWRECGTPGRYGIVGDQVDQRGPAAETAGQAARHGAGCR